MKKLTKIFMAVAALVMAASCITDPTEDLGANLGATGQTTLTVSLGESTKTHLGDKAGDKYPLYWSEGDQISVNGETSRALTAGGSEKGAFIFDSELVYPYNVLYPANEKYEVTFPTTQTHTEGTFSAGSTPMYGYAEGAGDAIVMQHLTGLLRFDITGEATLASLVVSAEEAQLSGTFAVDCTTGELTAVEGTTAQSVTLTFGEGLTLGAEATPIYVAVPAGSYGKVSVALYTTDGQVMVRKFDSSVKPISAGKVREFNEFAFEASASAEEGVYLIYSKESLIAFANAVNAATEGFDTTYPTAKVVADIDMSGANWTSINGFAGTFDGGNHKIKGLNAPLFGTTTASKIKDVHLTNVNIESSEGVIASLACKVNNTDAVISNCSAEGSLKHTSDASLSSPRIAGIIGESTSTKQIEGLVNRVNLHVETSTSSSFSGSIGGCIGVAAGGLNRCTNLGTIEFAKGSSTNTVYLGGVAGSAKSLTYCQNGELDKNGTPSEKGKIIYGKDLITRRYTAISGVALAKGAVSYCTNYAPIEINGDYNNTNTSDGRWLVLAGVNASLNSSNASSEVSNCKNYGKISINGTISAKRAANNNYIAGVVSGCVTAAWSNLENYGDIEFSETASFGSNLTLHIAGVVAATKTTGCSSFINKGDITINATKSTSATISVSGLVNSTVKTLNNASCYCNILAAGYTNVGMVTDAEYSADLALTNCNIGGSIKKGNATEATPLSLVNYTTFICGSGVELDSATEAALINSKNGWLRDENAQPQVKVTGERTISTFDELVTWATEEDIATSTANVALGANITIPEETTWTPIEGFNGILEGNDYSISGLTAPLFGTTGATIRNLHLTNVNIESAPVAVTRGGKNYLGLGALACGVDNANAEISNCSAAGTINAKSDTAHTTAFEFGGVIGSSNAATVAGLKNDVAMTLACDIGSGGDTHMGGCVGYSTGAKITNSINLGTIDIDCNIGAALWLGGICGRASKGFDNCINGSVDESGKPTEKGKITYKGDASALLLIGGIGEVGSDTAPITYCTNYAPIEVAGTQSGSNLYVGGIIGFSTHSHSTGTIENCSNYGEIDVTIENSATDGRVYVAGVAGGYYIKNSVNECSNYGNISVASSALNTNEVYVGGVVARVGQTGVTSGLKNGGDITVGSRESGNTYVGGLIGGCNGTVTNSRCYCTLKALGYQDSAGMITGFEYAENRATNCHIGGTIATTIDEVSTGPIWVNLDDWSFIEYIYGKTISTDEATASKLGWLEKNIDDTPIGADGAPIVEQ